MIRRTSAGKNRLTLLVLTGSWLLDACAQAISPTPIIPKTSIELPQQEKSYEVHSSPDPDYLAELKARCSPEIPVLPFADNPDPTLCGIPTQWGSNGQARLTGFYEGELIQPIVLLYDSHLRLEVKARFPHGTEVQILLHQQNPVTDYYIVKVEDAEKPNEGWIPGPFLSFEPV